MKNSTCCPLDNEPAAYLLEESGYSYFRCDACGLRFIWPLPDLEIILSIYGEGYRQVPPVPATQANLRAGAQEKRKRFLAAICPMDSRQATIHCLTSVAGWASCLRLSAKTSDAYEVLNFLSPRGLMPKRPSASMW